MEAPVDRAQMAPSSEAQQQALPTVSTEESRCGDRAESTTVNFAKESSAFSPKPPRSSPKELLPATLKELTPLVAMPPPSEAATVSRLSKQNYSRLGRNLLFEARPAVVHFGGYSVGKAHSQSVRVVNISRTSQRLHILGPSTVSFKMRCSKKGLVAPGSSEVITVDFHPREYRYHYDCVRLHTDSENLLIPLHAYPVMNDVVFPTRLDFGVHALGETARRTVKMVCKVPIQFEFEIEVTKPHPHFRVGPLRGIIPANGAAEVHVEHTPTTASSGDMEILVSVSQFNFTPITCVVTGAARPGIIRQDALKAAACRLGGSTLKDSLGPAHTEPSLLRDRTKKNGGIPATGTVKNGGGGTEWSNTRGGGGSWAGVQLLGEDGQPGDDTAIYDGFELIRGGDGADLVDTRATRSTSAEQRPYRTGMGSGAVFDVGGEWLAAEKKAGAGKPTGCWVPPADGGIFGPSIGGPPRTTVVEGLVIPARLDTVQATNFVLTQQPGKLKPKDLKEAIRQARADRHRTLQEQETLHAMTASLEEGAAYEEETRLPENLETHPDGASARLEAGEVNHHNVRAGGADADRGEMREAGVLGARGGVEARRDHKRGQPAQLSGKAICACERLALRGDGGGTGPRAGTKQLKEMSFLEDLAAIEAEERDRSFKGSVEYVGEPLLTRREATEALEERRQCEGELQRRKRADERTALETCLKGPEEVGARFAKASLLLTGSGTQGVGFDHAPDWDVYKNDDWGKRREVLRRLVNLVGKWVVRRRAGRRLAAIQARLRGLDSREGVAAMVERDNNQAKLAVEPREDTMPESRKASPNSCTLNDGWDFPDPLVTSQALAAEMLSKSMNYLQEYGTQEGGGGGFTRAANMPTPPPPEFQVSARDIVRHRFPMFEEGAALSRRPEAVDEFGPPTDFVDIDILPLKETEEGRAMGYECVRPTGPGTYPSIEKSRPLRWSAFEECGVRQPRDEDAETSPIENDDGDTAAAPAGWRKALSSTERRPSKATLGRRRSSVGLRKLPETVDNPEEAWLVAADEELTALATEAEITERLPDSLLLQPPPPGGVDLITPDPRFKAFLSEISVDEASPEWCLQPQAIPREVPVTKGLLLGYSPGSSTLRAYADAPRFHNFWKPNRERRSSGLACMRGQASRGVWSPSKAPTLIPNHLRCGNKHYGAKSGETHLGGDMALLKSRACGSSRGARGGPFELAAEAISAAAVAGDQLSESESDDEGESTAIPTPALARTMFDATPAADTVEPEQTNVAGTHGSRNSSERGGRRTQVLFERDQATATLARARRLRRNRDASRLSDRMGGIGAKVQNIRHAFVLQTPFHEIPTPEAKRA